MSKVNPYANLTKNLKAKTDKTKSQDNQEPIAQDNQEPIAQDGQETIAQDQSLSVEAIKKGESSLDMMPKKKGRPSTGKRSNPEWIGRTYYVKKEVEFDVADQLLQLKRQGIDLDKSDLVNFLLGEWLKSQNGENSTFRIGENIN